MNYPLIYKRNLNKIKLEQLSLFIFKILDYIKF